MADDLTAYMGTLDHWLPVYNKLPVVTRAALMHLHGEHADGRYEFCPLCEGEAEDARRIEACDTEMDRLNCALVDALAERDAALAAVAKLRETVAAIREHADRSVAWSLHTRQTVRDLCDSALADTEEAKSDG